MTKFAHIHHWVNGKNCLDLVNLVSVSRSEEVKKNWKMHCLHYPEGMDGF